MTKVTPLLAFTTPLWPIFLWIAPYIAEVGAIVVNGAKTFLAKGTVTFSSGPVNLPSKASINTPYRKFMNVLLY